MVIYKGAPIRQLSDFSTEIFQARREWCEIFKMIKSKDLQPKLLYPARLSFKTEGEIRSFPDKKKLKEFVNTKPVLQQMLEGLLEEEEEKEKEKRGKQSNNKITPHMYLSIITLNVNGLNAPTKRHRVAEWIRKQNP